MITKTKGAFWTAYSAHLVLIKLCGLWSFDLRSAWGLTGFLLVSLTYAALAAGFAIAGRAFAGVIAVRAMQATLSPGAARHLDSWISTGSVQKHVTEGLKEIVVGGVLITTAAWLLVVFFTLGNVYSWP